MEVLFISDDPKVEQLLTTSQVMPMLIIHRPYFKDKEFKVNVLRDLRKGIR